MTNQIVQQSKPDPKGKAIASLVLGAISILPFILLLIAFISPWEALRVFAYLFFVLPSYVLGLILATLGLICGTIGLKSSKKKLAITGIVFSTISLFILVVTVYIYKIIFEIGQR